MKTSSIVLATAFVGLVASATFADVDGNYCIGEGFVAVEARGLYLDAAKPSVHVVFVGPDELSERITIAIPDSDGNRTLHCESGRIVINDGTVIDISDPGSPDVSAAEPRLDLEFSADYLPFLRVSSARVVPSADHDHHYALVLTHVEQSAGVEGLLHHFGARVVMTDRSGNFIESRIVSEGVRLETVD